MTLQHAIEIAYSAHKDQKDRFENPYFLHVLNVMNRGKNENERIVGILHDVVEDTEWTFEELQKEGLDNKLIAALRCVTKIDENENYEDFISRVKTSALAIRVKINDLEDNMDIRRMPQVTEKDIPRMNKYLKAYKELIVL